MDLRALHAKYRDQDSPSVELQVKWLKRLGFEGQVVDRAILTVYTEIEQGEKDFKSGGELNLYLKEVAEGIRKDDLTAYVSHLEKFEAKLRKKWEGKLPWWKRWLGVKK